MVILITGSRHWTNENSIRIALKDCPPDTVIVHGGCRGADKLAGKVAISLGLEERVYPADWKKYGKKAGILRNVEMYNAEKVDKIIAFHENIEQSKGTKHMVNYARSKGFLNIEIITK